MPINLSKKRQFKRRFKKRRQQVDLLSEAASKKIDKHVFNKLDNFRFLWRYVLSWLTLIVIMISGVTIQLLSLQNYYLTSKPVAGGEFVEGVEGVFGNANPIYAANPADQTVSRLLFNGLLKYDNDKLVGDLADSWSINETGTIYTVKIRQNAKWHDGQPVTADDVVYTIQAIQNPDTLSPQNLNWQGVGVKASDPYTVVITLPSVLTSFAHSLTQGIVPKHILKDTPYANLRSAEFNNRYPIGSGPFSWSSFVVMSNSDGSMRQRINLKAFKDYHMGAPKLDGYTLDIFENVKDLVKALDNKSINGAAINSYETINDLDQQSLIEYDIPLQSGVYLFFNTQREPLNDKNVRKAMTHIIDTQALRSKLNHPVVGVNGPMLRNLSAYDPARVQLPFNIGSGVGLLDGAGWVKPPSSFVRQKNSKPLEFTVLSENRPEFIEILDVLQKQLADVGIKLNVNVKSGLDFQASLLSHDYDALLYGITIGMDPDVYVYWHSSQAVTDRFNFSEYKSKDADTALESGRSRVDNTLRNIKYRVFLDAWKEDAPAVGVYQPRLLFVASDNIFNFDTKILSQSSDRYSNVHNWMINTRKMSY